MNFLAQQAARRRKQAQLQEAAQPRAQVYRLPLPLGGWNLRDSPSDMPADDARQMDNLVPENGVLRNVIVGKAFGVSDGSAINVVGTGNFTNVHALDNGSAISFLLTTDLGDVIRLFSSGTAFTLGSISDTTPAVQYSKVVNGVLYVTTVDASSTAVSWLGTTDPTLDVVDVTSSSGHDINSKLNLLGPSMFKGRAYWWKNRKLPEAAFWYVSAAAGGVTGFLRKFDLSAFMEGTVLSVTRWTVDGGAGPDDYLVILGDTGQVLVYQGVWPEDADGWGLVGQYRIPRPISPNAVQEIGGKIMVATEQDYVLLPDALIASGALRSESKVAPRVRELAANKILRQHWQTKFFPDTGWIVVKAPLSTTNSELHCQTREGSWFRLTSCSAVCLTEVQGRLIFLRHGSGGVTGGTMQEINRKPNPGSGVRIGDPVLRTSWNRFGASTLKQLTAIRPQIWTSASGSAADTFPGLAYSVFADFNETDATGSAQGAQLSTHTSGSGVSNAWLQAYQAGQHISLHLKPTGHAHSELEIRGIDVLVQTLGGIA